MVPNIPAARRSSAVRALNRLGLEHEADSITRNVIACTGRQFCNIAVSETKGHAFGLMDSLRAKGVALAGIKINMSGCPSSCAQTYTGDIGLKGVRIRRPAGTCDAFDVFVGGGVQGKVELGRLYRKGVDLEQLPVLIAELVKIYDRLHSSGQSFSQFWRERLAAGHDPSAASAEEYRPEVWQCEVCTYKHVGEDPPVFCPKCAALRKNFVRLGSASGGAEEADSKARVAKIPFAGDRQDGFREVATLEDLKRDGRRGVQVDGRELALFLLGSEVKCLDGVCPHDGGPMAEGDVVGGIVSCPWHGWAFHCDTGTSADSNGGCLKTYPVKVEEGRIFVDVSSSSSSVVASRDAASPKDDATAIALKVIEVVQETPDVKTIRLDNRARLVELHRPGQHLKVCVAGAGGPTWRSFTVSSAPTRPDVLDLTIKRNPTGVVSTAIHGLSASAELKIKGPHGKFLLRAIRQAGPDSLV